MASVVISKKLAALEKPVRSLVRQLRKEAVRSGTAVYLVGGCVRDLLLKRRTIDVDVVIEGNAIDFARRLAKRVGGTLTAHRRFGTATVTLPDGRCIDCATARRETYAYPGALPSVTSGSIHDDLFRRDFTINAMAVALHDRHFGRLIDEYGGMRDLREGCIRVLHDKSFIDDPTRILRAIRFEQRFHFQIERGTALLLKKALRAGCASTVTSPRYFEEFRKMLYELSPVGCIRRLHALGGLKDIDSRIRFSAPMAALFGRIERSMQQLRHLLPPDGYERWVIFLMGLVFQLTPERAAVFGARVQLRKNDRDKLLENKKSVRLASALSRRTLSAHEIYAVLKPVSYETLVFVCAQSANARVRSRIKKFLRRYSAVRLTITGDDLIRMGIAPGKRVGSILTRVLYLKIDGKIQTHNDERRAALRMHARRELS